MSHPTNIAGWRALVDVNMWESRPYVIVDPASQATLLYLKQARYEQFVLNSVANGENIVVVATPSTPRELLGPPSRH
jgi:hypothetical protein